MSPVVSSALLCPVHRKEGIGFPMLHVVKLFERRFPNYANRIISSLLIISASALAVGLGLLLWR